MVALTSTDKNGFIADASKQPCIARLGSAIFVTVIMLSSSATIAKTLTYHSPEVGCNWLNAEYIRVQPRNDLDDEPLPSVTREGVMLTFSMLLFLPLILVDEVFGGEKEKYDFSDDLEDIAAAATDKNCVELLELMEADGNYTERRTVPRR